MEGNIIVTSNLDINLQSYKDDISPTSVLKRFNENVPKTKKRRRVTDDNFEILKHGEQQKLSINNYKVIQLKAMCRHYKQKVGGNKDELTKRLYNFLRLSFYASKIQKIVKRFIILKYIKCHGPAYTKRDICVNDTDFFTMQSLKSIKPAQFISFKDTDNFVYGFDIRSLYNLIKKGKPPYKNPYNRRELPAYIHKNISYIKHMSKYYKDEVELLMEEDKVDSKKEIELRALAIFQKIGDTTQYIVDHSWFWDLTRIRIIRFIRELHDIWTYRAQLSDTVKRQICYPYGNPFRNINTNSMQMQEIDSLRTISLTIIDNMISKGLDDTNKSLGSNYVLCALTLVSSVAAEQFPWLYQSVSHF